MFFFQIKNISLKIIQGEEKLYAEVLTIESMDRHKGGTYVCTANNGVGKPASSQVLLHVLCKSKYFNWIFILFLFKFKENNCIQMP